MKKQKKPTINKDKKDIKKTIDALNKGVLEEDEGKQKEVSNEEE